MRHPWFSDWTDRQHRLWSSLHLMVLADCIERGLGLTPEQFGCREKEALRTGRPGYDVQRVKRLREFAKREGWIA